MRKRQKKAVLQDSQETGWGTKAYGKIKGAGKQARTTPSDVFSAVGTSSAASDSTTRRGRRSRGGSEN